MSEEKETSLFERIGGEEAIAEMVDDFYGRVMGDSELAPFFENVPMDRLQRMQREFFGAATDGPIVYSGKPLGHVHQHLAIGKKHFQRFTEHLISTLQGRGLPEEEVLDLISRVNLYADEITNDTSVDG